MGPNLGQPDWLEKDDDHLYHHQVGSSLGQHDLLAEESGPLLPSVLPAPEVKKSKLVDLLKTFPHQNISKL